jgi:hypothetical protein
MREMPVSRHLPGSALMAAAGRAASATTSETASGCTHVRRPAWSWTTPVARIIVKQTLSQRHERAPCSSSQSSVPGTPRGAGLTMSSPTIEAREERLLDGGARPVYNGCEITPKEV